jgi:hypothetical protein
LRRFEPLEFERALLDIDRNTLRHYLRRGDGLAVTGGIHGIQSQLGKVTP